MKAEYLIKDTVIRPEQLESAVHIELMGRMVDLSKSGKHIDLITMSTLPDLEFLGGVSYLSELLSYADVEKFEEIEALIIDLWKKREKRNILKIATINDWEIAKVIGKLDKINEVKINDHTSLHDGLVAMYDAPWRDPEEMKTATTGLIKLDEMTGGFQDSEVTILAARPSMGKTDVMLHFAKAAGWADYLPIIFSLEMPERLITTRLIASTGGFNRRKMRNPKKLLNESQKKKWPDVIANLNETNIQIFDGSSQKIAEMRAKTRQVMKQFPNKKPIIFIDYLTLIQSTEWENFIQQIKSLSARFERIIDNIQTEEATKTSLILPLIQALGYDVFNPEELVPEFVADVGIKKGEKIDYAIMQNNEPVILIEAKSVHEKLSKHDSQLFRYFGTTKAKFAILTNGKEYKFFTDLDEQNKMDQKPFFTFNIFELKDNHVLEIAKFRKNEFNIDNVLTTASELKYTNEIKQFLTKEWEEPSEELVRFILNDVYQGVKTKKVIDSFRDIVKKSLNQFINEKVNDKLQKALNSTTSNEERSNQVSQKEVAASSEVIVEETDYQKQIITTQEEIEGYVLVKLLLKDSVESNRVYYRDNKSYMNVLIDDNIRKWVCRLGFNSTNKYIQLNDESKTTYKIDSVDDIMVYKEGITKVAKQFL